MNKKVVSFITLCLVMMIFIGLTSCNQKDENKLDNYTEDNYLISDSGSYKEIETVDAIDKIAENIEDESEVQHDEFTLNLNEVFNQTAFIDVLTGVICTRQSFAFTDSYSDICSETPLVWREYTILDLDGNGSSEIVVLVTDESEIVHYYTVFAESDNNLYAYRVSYRGMLQIMEDGTIMGSSGASSGSFYKISCFSETGLERYVLAEEDLGTYVINGIEVSSDEYYAFTQNELNKSKCVWIPMT